MRADEALELVVRSAAQVADSRTEGSGDYLATRAAEKRRLAEAVRVIRTEVADAAEEAADRLREPDEGKYARILALAASGARKGAV